MANDSNLSRGSVMQGVSKAPGKMPAGATPMHKRLAMGNNVTRNPQGSGTVKGSKKTPS